MTQIGNKKKSKKWRPTYTKEVVATIGAIAISLPLLIAFSFTYVMKSSHETIEHKSTLHSSSFHKLRYQRHVAPTNYGPEIAWLVSYTQSRDSFIRKVVHDVSKTSMASNYEVDVDDNERVVASKDEQPMDKIKKMTTRKQPPPEIIVPFRLRQSAPLPRSYLLTDTHCSGYDLTSPTSSSSSSSFVTTNVDDFYHSCAQGHTLSGRHILYDPRYIRKIVHLIRNPFDNIVQRFQFLANQFNQQHGRRGGRGDNKEWRYGNGPEGFRRWCTDLDDKMKHRLRLSEEQIEMATVDVPCFSLFYQYVMWHNNVVEMSRRYDLDVFVTHFEDYDSRDKMKSQTKDLFQFLGLDVMGSYPRYETDDFTPFFTHHNRIMISSYVKVLAAEGVWVELKRYLLPPLHESHFAPMGSVLSPFHYGKWPQDLIWLLSYPHAGAGDVSRMVRMATDTTTASNYAISAKLPHRPNVKYDGESGPYRTSGLPFPERFILTKTYCHDGLSAKETPTVSLDDFLNDCAKVSEHDSKANKTYKGRYDFNIVKKLVHLIRNPFDNIVARFQHETFAGNPTPPTGRNQKPKVKTTRKGKVIPPTRYRYDSDGFRQWCTHQNSLFPPPNKLYHAFIGGGADVPGMAEHVPCHALLYQYVRWHDYAFAVAKRLQIPSLVLYQEDFYFNRDQTMMTLLEFLELDLVGDLMSLEFHHDTYPDSLTKRERDVAVRFIKAISSRETGEALGRYLVTKDIFR